MDMKFTKINQSSTLLSSKAKNRNLAASQVILIIEIDRNPNTFPLHQFFTKEDEETQKWIRTMKRSTGCRTTYSRSSSLPYSTLQWANPTCFLGFIIRVKFQMKTLNINRKNLKHHKRKSHSRPSTSHTIVALSELC